MRRADVEITAIEVRDPEADRVAFLSVQKAVLALKKKYKSKLEAVLLGEAAWAASDRYTKSCCVIESPWKEVPTSTICLSGVDCHEYLFSQHDAILPVLEG